MIRQLHKAKNTIWIILLMAFSVVYVVDFLCDFGVLNIYESFHHNTISDTNGSVHNHEHTNQIAEHENVGHHNFNSLLLGEESEPTTSHPSPNDVNDDEHTTNTHQNESTTHNHTGTSDDDCCKDETNAVFSSLINHPTVQINIDANHFILYLIEPYELFSKSIIDKFHPFKIFHDLPPPNSGYFIRILIQSFLN